MTTGANTGERDVRNVSFPHLPAASHGLRHLPGMWLPAILPQHDNGHLRRSRVVRSDLLLGFSHRHRRDLVSAWYLRVHGI